MAGIGLLHKQPDDVWRIDLQLGRDADAELEKRPENVVPRIRRMLGHDAFSLEWVSVYTFQCRRLARFVHGRVIFAGDSAHQVSPLRRARGQFRHPGCGEPRLETRAGSRRRGGPDLIATYDLERVRTADENISQLHPRHRLHRAALGRRAATARCRPRPCGGGRPSRRRLVNSGRCRCRPPTRRR